MSQTEGIAHQTLLFQRRVVISDQKMMKPISRVWAQSRHTVSHDSLASSSAVRVTRCMYS